MKTRCDFVSNSSSCSFVIDTRAAEAAKMFLEDFGEYLSDAGVYEAFGESFKVGTVCDGNEDEWHDWTDPSSFAVDYTIGRWRADDEGRAAPSDPSSIKSLAFECDDYDKTGMMWLLFLMQYFKKFGFETDDKNSEIAFEETSASFLAKIIDRMDKQCSSKVNDQSKM